jgi:hypothetical protein
MLKKAMRQCAEQLSDCNKMKKAAHNMKMASNVVRQYL